MCRMPSNLLFCTGGKEVSGGESILDAVEDLDRHGATSVTSLVIYLVYVSQRKPCARVISHIDTSSHP